MKTIEMNELLNTKWILEKINDKELLDIVNFTIEFSVDGNNQTKINGKACNNYFGGIEFIDNNKIKIGPIGSTMMACEPEIMELEQTYFEFLQEAEKYEIKDGELILRPKEGAIPESHLLYLCFSTIL